MCFNRMFNKHENLLPINARIFVIFDLFFPILLSICLSLPLCVQCAGIRIHFDVFSWKRVFHYSLLFYLLWQPQPTNGNNKNSCFFLLSILLHLCIVQSKIGSTVSEMHMRVDVICAATMRYENHYSFWSNHVGHDVHCSLRTFVCHVENETKETKMQLECLTDSLFYPKVLVRYYTHSLFGLPSPT